MSGGYRGNGGNRVTEVMEVMEVMEVTEARVWVLPVMMRSYSEHFLQHFQFPQTLEIALREQYLPHSVR